MSYQRDLNLRLEVHIKLLHHTPGLDIIQILPLTLPLPRHTLALNGEIPLLEATTKLNHEVIHQIPVQLLKIAHQAWLTVLHRVEETEVRYQLRPDYCSMHLPLENLIGQVENVIRTIISLELTPPLRPQRARAR